MWWATPSCSSRAMGCLLQQRAPVALDPSDGALHGDPHRRAPPVRRRVRTGSSATTHAAAQGRAGGQGAPREALACRRPEREVAARRVPGDHDPSHVGLRQLPGGQCRYGVECGGHVVEGLRPAPRPPGPHGLLPLALRAAAPVLHAHHPEPAGPGSPQRSVRARTGPAGAAVHQDHGGAPVRPSRGVEVDDLVGMVAVGGGPVGGDHRMCERRLGLGDVPITRGRIRHAAQPSYACVLCLGPGPTGLTCGDGPVISTVPARLHTH
ncbi:hypothetical protein SMICM17S_06945 [Streptomyces microflavus]